MVISTEGTIEVVLSWICGGGEKIKNKRRFISFFFCNLFLFNRICIIKSHSQGHLSFTSPWPSVGLSLQHRWNRETKYFSKLQEKTFWHAWNLPENCIKIKSGELRVPHQHERSRHLYIFWVAGSTIKKLRVCGIKDGGRTGPTLWQRWLWERPDHLLSHALYVLADVHDGMQSSFVLFVILPITCCAHLKSY